MQERDEVAVKLIAWSRMYEIGVPEVDRQHRELIELTTKLVDAVHSGHGRAATVPVLKDLIQYTKTHFHDEEALMERVGFPDLAEHRREHERFIQEVAAAAREVLTGTGVPTTRILNFLSDWLVDHIMVFDRKIGVYMKQHGITGS